jgi:lysophospholipase L1-like esterase
MRDLCAVALGLAMVACDIAAAGPGPPQTTLPSKTTKKKKTAPASTPPSPAARAAAARKVDAYLEGSAASPFEQPGALAPFFERLLRLSSGSEADRPAVHIVHFGDSHTAADEWTGGLRDLFKERFGDGGSGFSLAGRPFPGYRRFDARGSATSGWSSEGGHTGKGDGYFGLGGVGVYTDRPGQSVSLEADCTRMEIQFLRQPDGGRLALYDGDEYLEDISTDGELGPGFVAYATAAGAHRFVLKTLDRRPVRLFGWVADKPGGVTYEALGLNGAEAGVILKWDGAMFATYLGRRDPALIVLAYGTNEASDPVWTQESYRNMFARLVERLREDAPTATILALGPADRWGVVRGRWQIHTGIDGIIADQKEVCRKLGCAYWDTRARMGGPGSMRDWLTAGLSQNDRVHFTAAGYSRLASTLFADLMEQYEAYRQARLESADQEQP